MKMLPMTPRRFIVSNSSVFAMVGALADLNGPVRR